MAMPRPASDSMDIDFAIMAGISTCHLQDTISTSNCLLLEPQETKNRLYITSNIQICSGYFVKYWKRWDNIMQVNNLPEWN